MLDFLGEELQVGDTVVFIKPRYREFWKGRILRFTKCYVIVEYNDCYTGELKQTPDQLIKV